MADPPIILTDTSKSVFGCSAADFWRLVRTEQMFVGGNMHVRFPGYGGGSVTVRLEKRTKHFTSHHCVTLTHHL